MCCTRFALSRLLILHTSLILVHSTQQEHEAFEAESRHAYETEISSLSQQLDAHVRITDELMRHSKDRRANEAAAIESAAIFERTMTEMQPKISSGGHGAIATGTDTRAGRDRVASECASLRRQVAELELKLEQDMATREAYQARAISGSVGDDGRGHQGRGCSDEEASEALAVAASHQCIDPDNPKSVLAAVQRLGAALAETEDELVELTEQLTEALQALSVQTSLVTEAATREAELQAELDVCHETIEQLAAQLDAPQ